MVARNNHTVVKTIVRSGFMVSILRVVDFTELLQRILTPTGALLFIPVSGFFTGVFGRRGGNFNVRAVVSRSIYRLRIGAAVLLSKKVYYRKITALRATRKRNCEKWRII